MRRTYEYVAVTQDEVQRRRWTFYEAVQASHLNKRRKGERGISKDNLAMLALYSSSAERIELRNQETSSDGGTNRSAGRGTRSWVVVCAVSHKLAQGCIARMAH
jgi:hypothetical protein